jgi:hypothetical protein
MEFALGRKADGLLATCLQPVKEKWGSPAVWLPLPYFTCFHLFTVQINVSVLPEVLRLSSSKKIQATLKADFVT